MQKGTLNVSVASVSKDTYLNVCAQFLENLINLILEAST